MYFVTDSREEKEIDIITFEDVKIGEFFYGQVFDGSINEVEKQLCLKVDEENYFCFSTAYNCLLYHVNCPVAVMEIFNEDNKNKVKISIE